jgi:osmotically-inducible protein OsmY
LNPSGEHRGAQHFLRTAARSPDRRAVCRRATGVGARAFLLHGALIAAVLALVGCAPALVAVGVGHAIIVATDPRSTGAQIDDETIELRLVTNETVANENVHVNATSYNGVVLLTGEVPTPAMREEIGRIAQATDRVRVVHNELSVGPNSDLGARTQDASITSKVKARLFEEGKFAPNQIKVVTETGVVYLMGLLTRDEAATATQIAATTAGVLRVVKVIEYTN